MREQRAVPRRVVLELGFSAVVTDSQDAKIQKFPSLQGQLKSLGTLLRIPLLPLFEVGSVVTVSLV